MNHEGVDTLYRRNEATPSRFCFDSQVATVFADMIARSVPGYGLTLEMIGIIAERYATPDSILYDLGCSLGASTLAMRHAVAGRGCRIVAVDNSDAMVTRCREIIVSDGAGTPVDVRCANVCDLVFEPASVAVMNFTLQFIPLDERLPLLQGIAAALGDDGVLVLSEKITFDEPWEARAEQSLHEAFKAAQGYSELEISRKRQALEDVLLPETVQQHRQRLLEAGFSHVMLWFQCANFVSMLAFRRQP